MKKFILPILLGLSLCSCGTKNVASTEYVDSKFDTICAKLEVPETVKDYVCKYVETHELQSDPYTILIIDFKKLESNSFNDYEYYDAAVYWTNGRVYCQHYIIAYLATTSKIVQMVAVK